MYLADSRVSCDFNYWRFNVMGRIVNNINFFPTLGKSELCFLWVKLGEIDVCCVYLTQSIVLTNYHCVFYPLRTLYNIVVVFNKIIFQSKSVWVAGTVPEDYNFTVAYDEGWILTEKIDRARGSFNVLDLLDTIPINTQNTGRVVKELTSHSK